MSCIGPIPTLDCKPSIKAIRMNGEKTNLMSDQECWLTAVQLQKISCQAVIFLCHVHRGVEHVTLHFSYLINSHANTDMWHKCSTSTNMHIADRLSLIWSGQEGAEAHIYTHKHTLKIEATRNKAPLKEKSDQPWIPAIKWNILVSEQW